MSFFHIIAYLVAHGSVPGYCKDIKYLTFFCVLLFLLRERGTHVVHVEDAGITRSSNIEIANKQL